MLLVKRVINNVKEIYMLHYDDEYVEKHIVDKINKIFDQ